MERKYKTPAAFARAVDKYFDAIRVVRPLIREEIDYQQTEDGSYTVRLDQYGHPAKKYVRQIAADGKPAVEEIWIKKPSAPNSISLNRRRVIPKPAWSKSWKNC